MKQIFTVLFTTLFVSVVWSQNPPDYNGILGQQRINTITTAVPFLMIAPDARSGALGDAGVSLSPDINSMHWNPAKYAFFRDNDFYKVDEETGDTLAIKDNLFSVGLNYTPWLRSLVPDINLSNLVGVYRPDDNQALAFSVKYFTLGDVNLTDEVGTFMGTVRPREFAFDVAYARKLGANFSTALALRYIYSDLTQGQLEGSQAGTSIAFDLAAYYRKPFMLKEIPSTIALGMNVSNIGSKITYTDDINADFIPVNLRIGPSVTLDFHEHRSLSLMVDFNKLLVPTPPIYARDENGQVLIGDDGNYVIESGRDPNRSLFSGMTGSFSDAPGGFSEELKEITMSFGAEYVRNEYLTLRTGYFHEHEIKGNRKYFTAGLGLRYLRYRFDFAYVIPVAQRSPLENVLRFSLGANF